MAEKPVYGDTLNHMFPYGYMLYNYFGSGRVRLIHLVRDPVTCCRSIIKSERAGQNVPDRFHELRPDEFIQGKTDAEKAAGIWNGVNGMVQTQFNMINDPQACKTVRLEDVSVELVNELFDFIGLQGFDRARVEDLLGDSSHDVRHSHIERNPERVDASDAELREVERLCYPLAWDLGYRDSND